MPPKSLLSASERFDALTERQPNGCLLWIGTINRSTGYGGFRAEGRRHVNAHRYAYERAYGPLGSGREALHNCPDGDNRACVEPAHLWDGTQGDNVRDARKKGRLVRTNAKLTFTQVNAIRRRYAAGGVKQDDLARDYGISQAQVSCITTGKHWKIGE